MHGTFWYFASLFFVATAVGAQRPPTPFGDSVVIVLIDRDSLPLFGIAARFAAGRGGAESALRSDEFGRVVIGRPSGRLLVRFHAFGFRADSIVVHEDSPPQLTLRLLPDTNRIPDQGVMDPPQFEALTIIKSVDFDAACPSGPARFRATMAIRSHLAERAAT